MCSSVTLRVPATAIVAISVVIARGGGATARAVETLEMANTTSALQRYEKLYAKVDVEIERQYTARDRRLGGIDQPQRRAGAGLGLVPQRPPSFYFANQIGGGNELLKKSETIHLVSQDEKLRMDWKGVDRYADDTTRSWRRVLLCDGKETRFYDDAPLHRCYSISGILKEIDNLQPHRLFLGSWHMGLPLSVFLKGERLRDVVYQGEEEYQGLKCRRIRTIHFLDAGRKPWLWNDVWLAETRNLIPARMLEYRLRDSESHPSGEAIVDKWQEIKPGVWFPTSATVTKYDLAVPQSERAQKPGWVERYTVKRVSLEPKYDMVFFQQFDQAPGAARDSSKAPE